MTEKLSGNENPETPGGANTLTSNENFVGNLVYRYAFPSVCALLGMQASGFINSMIIGNVLGGIGLSVVSLVAPVSLVYFSIGSLIGVGASIISGTALGKGDKVLYAQMYTLSYLVALILGAGLTILALVNLDRIVTLLGAEGEFFAYTRDYLRFYIPGGISMLLIYIPLNFLRISGKPNIAMFMLLVMSLLNVICLLIFTVILGMGLGGLALASVTSAAITFIFGASRFWGKDSPLKLRKPAGVMPRVGAMVVAGSPSALNNVCQAIQILGINLLLVKIGTGAFLPAYSLVNATAEFLLAFILGVSQAALPMVSISLGERDFRSIRIILKKAFGLGSIIVGVSAVFLFFFRNTLGLVFGLRDSVLLMNTARGLIFLALSLNLSFINNILANYYNAIGRPAIANIIVFCRLVCFMILPAYLLFAALNINAVWISLILAEAVTLAVVYLVVTVTHARNPGLSRYLLLDSKLVELTKTIDFSVRNTADDVTFASSKISDFCEDNEVPAKKIMQISLAIEEMLIMIDEFSHNPLKVAYTDVRMVVAPESIVLRIRNTGKYFNPLDYYEENKDTEEGFDRTLGIAMIVKMAKQVQYQKTFGVNNLIITI
jgi:Na+-driven multidrug efflux pump/anti-sigma regulatory factor (Ser/Thr protein kinase)